MADENNFKISPDTSNSRGFALLTVLFALAIISGLTAIATSEIAVHVRARSLQINGQIDTSVSRSSLHIAAAYARDLQEEGGVNLIETNAARFGGTEVEVSVFDVGGLIDVNTARIDLLRAFLGAADAELTDAIADVKERRRSEQKFLSVEEFAALASLDGNLSKELQNLLTAHSGRNGVSPEHAPTRLLGRLLGRTGDRRTLESAFPTEWRSPPTNRTYKSVTFDAQAGRRIGEAVISISSDGAREASLISATR